ncbi:MAG TPA: group I intron-associated PD-(D/E)XK endonuclease [Kofleriaceae bacterium]|jgi:hypothetical protein|nr:group I intron-associated PD-(D/E)XK endonuclease [Kofleriaceae bacterium]
MREHHTKTKGDLGTVKAMADLAAKGWGLLVPITEHEAFDLVVYRRDRFLRVQVKYRAAVNGAITFPLKTCWADRHGVHTRLIDRTSVDLICIYCPDTDRCYYVDPQLVDGVTVCLRLEPPRNYQVKRILWARDCTELPVSVAGVPPCSTGGLVESTIVRHSREPWGHWLLSARSSIG